MARSRKVDLRWRTFVDEYIVDFNAARAVASSGYKDPKKRGCLLLQIAAVQTMLAAKMAAREQRTQVTQDRVVRELARIAFADLRRMLEWGPEGVKVKSSAELTDDDAAAIAEVSETKTEHGGTIKVKLVSKDRALEMLGRHLAMFTDRTLVDDLSNLSDDELTARLAAAARAARVPGLTG